MGVHNHKAIFAAVVLNQVLGFIWYSPMFFGEIWLKALKLTEMPVDRGDSLPFMAALWASILLCYLMSWFFQVAVVEDWKSGFSVGLLIGLGFLAPTLIMHELFMGVAAEVIMIDASKEILGAGLTGILLATWRAERSLEEAQ
jgi:hypothetical protein